jgi:hypothetical protein
MEESGQLMLSWRESLLFTSSTKRHCFLLRCLPQRCARHPWECKHSKLEDREAPRLPCPVKAPEQAPPGRFFSQAASEAHGWPSLFFPLGTCSTDQAHLNA